MPDGPEGPGEARLRTLRDFVGRAADPSWIAKVDMAAAEVIAGFDDAGVPLLLLKGPALAQALYRPGEQRRYMDVDLLVPPGHRVRAGSVLSGLGYANASKRTGVDEFTGAVHAETWHRPGGSAVDLHWRLAGCTTPPEQAWPKLFEDRATILVAGRPAAVLGRAGLALHLATHAAQHGPRDVKAMGDLARGVERWSQEDWRAAAGLADALEATDAFAAGLRLLPEGADLARRLDLPATDQFSWKILHRRERPRGTFHLEALARARGVRETAYVLRRSLLPSPEWIAAQHPRAAGSRPRMLAAYIKHVLRTPAWAARAWRYRRQARRAARDPD